MILGEAIKFIRNYLELTQEEVCRRANLTQGFYSSIENGIGTPSLETLERIANAFNVPLFWIICKATQQQDIPKNKRGIYNTLKPTLEDILEELIAKEHD